ncbi:FAD-dependent monooxygenase [Lapillicoccus jejuensis]|uniref:2-polyprenyl-6-methoxyphenol hydroxylase-like FAD-dependent oxidoreductase n=1 Tax=Lapillicoccus jejuensis TaxID=402171 RepID=A0A542E4Z4_9MICO|nr:FAD-dependent monooxygenase [Lapillicoccus jejuensis]TQJ10387.1 2-polyprenyl-6-methoxyphenol hydroxylase-like FAD-dependent oxidoreductase [Lapillicoccus jejuensis]
MTTAPHALVTGASIAGLSTAWWLSRVGWRVTVLERADGFREGGQNVDVRGVGREVLHRMGLYDAVLARNTTEVGTRFVDDDGGVVAELPSDDPDGATAELEVLRGDLAGLLRDRLPETVELVFGDSLETLTEEGDAAVVRTHAGRTFRADLVVVAEGVRSSTRDQLLADATEPTPLGITMVFGTIPRTDDDDRYWRWYTAPGGRQVHLRPDPHGTTRAMLAYAHGDDEDEGLAGVDRDTMLARLRGRFTDAGWQAQRVLDGFAASDDVYADDLERMTVTTYHRGRVVLAGDAAWCVTPLGGGGASLALTGGYVLAAFLSTSPDDREAALTSYEAWMRELVDAVPSFPRAMRRVAFPQTGLGLAVRNTAAKVATSPPFSTLAGRFGHVAQSEQPLPELREAAPA